MVENCTFSALSGNCLVFSKCTIEELSLRSTLHQDRSLVHCLVSSKTRNYNASEIWQDSSNTSTTTPIIVVNHARKVKTECSRNLEIEVAGAYSLLR